MTNINITNDSAWIGYKILGFTIVLVALIQLVLTNYLSTTGADLSLISSKIDSVSAKNMVLETKIGGQMSITTLAGQAAKLGMDKPKIVFSQSQTPVALRPQI